MKTPEKVYIDDFGSGFSHGWHTEHSYENDIEYVRKDAFIEKAKKWFEECFMNVHRWEISTYEFENIQSMIDEFRKYMEGE